MEVATLARAVLLVALTTACHAVANGAEIETLKISSAPRVLGPLEVITEGKEKKNVAPNGDVIATVVLSDWKQEEEPVEVQNEFNTEHHLPTACTAIPSVNDGETFFGTSREVAKTRVADSPVEEANLTVKGYHTSHPSDADMQKSSISTSCDAERVDVERKNVTVAAYLIAAKKENDNDYHLILQDKDCKDPSCRLTVEISGIPRLNGSQAVLKTARQAFKEQLLLYTPPIEFPDSGHYLFFKTPILVRVTGSAFYDADHPVNPDTGTGPVGPDCCKPGSTWEVHPVTSFEFVPQTEVSPFALINRAHNE